MAYSKSDLGHGVLLALGLVVLATGCSSGGGTNGDMLATSGDPSTAGDGDGDGADGSHDGVSHGRDEADDAGGASTHADAGGVSADGDAAPSGPSFPAVTDFAARGPFDTMNEPGGSDCTVYRPKTLGDGGLEHPVLVWGNGTLANPTLYNGVLDHWASHGFIVAAANTSNAGTGKEMIACLEWVLAEAARADSAYAGHVDTAHAGASGHSQGGGGTIMAGRDARMTATVPLEPYTQGLGHDAASQMQQHGPMLLLSGSADTIAPSDQNQKPVFEASNVPTFWGTLQGADHISSATGDISGFRGPATAWFRLHLMNDQSARELFYGADCTLCMDSMWQVQKKDID